MKYFLDTELLYKLQLSFSFTFTCTTISSRGSIEYIIPVPLYSSSFIVRKDFSSINELIYVSSLMTKKDFILVKDYFLDG